MGVPSKPGVFRSRLEDLMPAVELRFPPTPAFGDYRPYLEHAVEHPAKANVSLLEFLILKYTEEGDTILDPMAGSFSTVIIAILKGRNAIGVDIEKRYADWGREALLKTKDIFARLVAELRENPPLEGWCECEDGSENL
jgi:hypothetical protein